MPSEGTSKRPLILAIWLIVGGLIGIWAAFQLTLDKIAIAADPNAQLSCNISVLVGCSKNLQSWQGELLGFPNPLIGLVGWTATISVGVGILAGARWSRWFWLVFNAGVVLALALVVFLIDQSLTALDVLCPYCMVTWSVTIPTFWVVTLHNLRSGNIPASEPVRRFARAAYGWIPLIVLVCYAIVAVLAQIQLDWLHRL